MAAAQTLERPVALVVEDRQQALANQKALFTQHGFQAIGARSMAEALREFRSTPAIDIVVTDINLDESNKQDRSGVDLARAVRSRRPTLPVVAFSGQFDALYPDEQVSFDDHLLKGSFSIRTFEGRLDTWRKRALDYRKLRADKARNELTRMRSAGAMSPEVEVLRDFLPGSHPTNLATDGDFETPDDMLRREGWKLQLVDAGCQIAGADVKTGVAVPFWLRQEQGVTIAVLHGHSCIYHDGADEEAAVKGALELMFGYAQEFEKEGAEPLSGELAELQDYLDKVFG